MAFPLRTMGTPNASIAAAVGSIAIKHSHLDHVLRLSIKRMLEMSIKDPAYKLLMDQTMTSKLVLMLRKQLAVNDRFTSAQKTRVKRILKDVEPLTDMRNTLVHSVWARYKGENLQLIHGARRDVQAVPSHATMRECGKKIDELRKELDDLTRSVFNIEAVR